MFSDLQPCVGEVTKRHQNQIFWMTYRSRCWQTFYAGMELDLTQRLFGDEPLKARLWPDDGQTMEGGWHDGGQPVDGTELAFSDRTDLIRPQSLHTPPPIHASMLTISWHQSSTCLSGVRKSIHFFWKYAKDICHFQHDLICNFARDVYKTCKMCKKRVIQTCLPVEWKIQGFLCFTHLSFSKFGKVLIGLMRMRMIEMIRNEGRLCRAHISKVLWDSLIRVLTKATPLMIKMMRQTLSLISVTHNIWKMNESVQCHVVTRLLLWICWQIKNQRKCLERTCGICISLAL